MDSLLLLALLLGLLDLDMSKFRFHGPMITKKRELSTDNFIMEQFCSKSRCGRSIIVASLLPVRSFPEIGDRAVPLRAA